MGAGGSGWHGRAPQPLGLVLRVSASAQVAEAKGKADEARLQAQAALDKANQTRARVESSNRELRELISQVKAFLSRECRRAGGAGRPCPTLCGSAPTPHCTEPASRCTAWSPHCMWAVPPWHCTTQPLPRAALHAPCSSLTILCPPTVPCPMVPPHGSLWLPMAPPCLPLPIGPPVPSTPGCCRGHTDSSHPQRRGLTPRASRW